jgi:uncharacterized protein YdaU (DUF1376 family)
MAEFPALPLWTDAFLSDTMHLDATETGAYLLLLMTAWRRPNNDLPDDDVQLRRFARCTPAQWLRIKPRVMAFWTLHEKSYRQKKLDLVRNRIRNLQEKKRSAAFVRWNKPLKTQRAPDTHAARLHVPRISNQNQNQNKSLIASEELQALCRKNQEKE